MTRVIVLIAVLIAGCDEPKQRGFHYDEFGHPSSAAPRPIPSGPEKGRRLDGDHGDITT